MAKGWQRDGERVAKGWQAIFLANEPKMAKGWRRDGERMAKAESGLKLNPNFPPYLWGGVIMEVLNEL